jgi:hypothetical protein
MVATFRVVSERGEVAWDSGTGDGKLSRRERRRHMLLLVKWRYGHAIVAMRNNSVLSYLKI